MTLGVLLNLSGPRFLLEREGVIIPTSQCFPENSTREFESFGRRPGEEGATPCAVISWHIPAAVGSWGRFPCSYPHSCAFSVTGANTSPHFKVRLRVCSANVLSPKHQTEAGGSVGGVTRSGLLWARPGDWAWLRLLFAEAPGLGWTAGRWPSIMTTDCVLARPWPLMPLPPPQQKLASLPRTPHPPKGRPQTHGLTVLRHPWSSPGTQSGADGRAPRDVHCLPDGLGQLI